MKKMFLIIFNLIMMCSVSFGIEENIEYYSVGDKTGYADTTSIGSYTPIIVYDTLNNYFSDTTNENYKTAFNTLIEYLENDGYKYVVYYSETSEKYCLLVANKSYNTQIVKIGNKLALLEKEDGGDSRDLGWMYGSQRNYRYIFYTKNPDVQIFYITNGTYNPDISSVYKSNTNIYEMTKGSTSSKYYWDGFNYYYEVPEQENSNFTDEEIAEVVTRFVNSDAYLTNNKNEYNDFFITYNNLTKYYRAYTYHENMDLAISYGNYNEDGEFVTTGTEEGEAWQIRPYVFDGNIFRKLYDWLSSKYNNVSFTYYSISPDSTINPRYVGDLEYSYCSDYRENEFVVYSTKQIRFLGEETNSEGETETIVIDDYIPKTVLINSETGEEIVIENNMQDSSDSLENIITPNADFSGLKEAFEKYIAFVNISSITWLTTAISSMITIFVPFVALGIILFLINRILNGGS